MREPLGRGALGDVPATGLATDFRIFEHLASHRHGRVSEVLSTTDLSPDRQTCFMANVTAGADEPGAVVEFARRIVRASASLFDNFSDVLAHLDDVLVREHPGVYVTAQFVSVERYDDAVTVDIANCGHLPPLHIRAGSACIVGLRGVVLGTTARRHRHTALSRVTLRCGDQLLLFNEAEQDPPTRKRRAVVPGTLPDCASDRQIAEVIHGLRRPPQMDVIVISGHAADETITATG